MQGLEKFAIRRDGGSNSIDLYWLHNENTMTLMPSISADDRACTKFAVLPDTRTEYRMRDDGIIDTHASFIHPNTYVPYHDPDGVDSSIYDN